MSNPAVRVLIIDDSVFMRTMLKSAFEKTSDIQVVGTAQNGREGLDRVASLKPDVITLDVEMPGVDGIEVLRTIMRDKPLPVVMVSTKTQQGAELTLDALELGAVECVAKPLAAEKASLQEFQNQVVQAVRTAFASNRSRLGKSDATKVLRPRTRAVRTDDMLVAIGISAGGPATLHKLIPVFPKVFPPMVVTQHMPADFTGPFAKRLSDCCEFDVKEAAEGDVLKPGTLHLAPGDRHLKVVRRGSKLVVNLDDGPKVSGFRPSVDVLFESVVKAVGANAVGLVMTGMGWDGAAGIRQLKEAGAATLAQDRESSIVYGMPKAAADTGCVDRVVSLGEIAHVLTGLVAADAITVG